eukprot:m.11858 g.11858  ORF g.11858 m.11858 type:complete len:73 (+) comp4542_c0_seq1:196-414(+)
MSAFPYIILMLTFVCVFMMTFAFSNIAECIYMSRLHLLTYIQNTFGGSGGFSFVVTVLLSFDNDLEPYVVDA